MSDGRGFTTSQVAERLHVSTGYIRKQIASGALASNGGRVGDHRHRLRRQDIYKWLLNSSWEAKDIRRLFPLPGPLFTIGVGLTVRAALALEYPKHFFRFFDLALAVSEVRPWGIVVGLPMMGSRMSESEFTNYSNIADRPALIALCGEDDGIEADEVTVTGGVFDFKIRCSLPSGKIAQRVRALRPWGK